MHLADHIRKQSLFTDKARKLHPAGVRIQRKAGIKVQVLQQYERGARDINGAKLPTLLKICNALECRLADIITDEETLELLKKYEEH